MRDRSAPVTFADDAPVSVRPHPPSGLLRAAACAVATAFALVALANSAGAYTVVTSDEDVLVDCGTSGTSVPTDWYFPVPNPNLGLVWVQHGFSRANNQFVDLATKIAADGYVVFATSLAPGTAGCAMNNAGFLSDFARLFPDLGNPSGSLRSAAAIAASEAGTSLGALPATFAFVGHSAGGGSIAAVGKELVTTHPASAAGLRGLAFLDPVESTSGSLMASALASLASKRMTTVSSPPYTCNSSASGTALLAALPRPFVGVELTSGCHCDAEGASTDALCTLFCGTPQAANVAALQTLTRCWLGDFFTGNDTPSCYPGGSYYASELAAGRIRTLPDPSSCGNGTVEAGEQCDDGNAANGDCCSGVCRYEPAGTACAADGNACTSDVCDGAGTCGVPNTAPCDDGVYCNGTDTCSGGACSQHAGDPCAGGAECATTCNEATSSCATPAGVPCGGDGNPCTLDVCTGTGACGHPAGNPGVVCRAIAGACDVTETCTGSATTCPADGWLAAGTACRPAVDVCDAAESCTGTDAACPADARRPSGTACPADGNPCTLDQCDGTSTACAHPAGNAGVVCRPSAGVCDVAESCSGLATVCPGDDFAASSVVCRPAAGGCDAAETCTGSGAACPADAVLTAATVCRPAAGPCDLAETCNGTGVACPANGFASAAIVCRPAAAICDAAEHCPGTSAACPTDALAASTVTCRPSAGACDAAEHCTGTDGACPADEFLGPAATCRPSTGTCDVPEQCSGASVECPADTGQPDDDGDGVCDLEDGCPTIADPAQADADGDARGDACDPCTNTVPVHAVKAKLTIRNLLPPLGDERMKLSGTMTLPTSSIDPATTGLRVLVVDGGGQPVVDAAIPPGDYDPVTATGWNVNGSRTTFTFVDKGSHAPALAGITKVVVKRSRKVPGSVRISIAAAGGSYPVPGSLPLTATVIFDPPYAATNACGDALFPGPARPSCGYTPPEGTIQCR